MTLQIPKPTSRITFIVFGYGLIVLIWLSLEDKGMLSVAILGTGAAHLIILLSIWQRIGGKSLSVRVWFSGMILVGGLIGATSALVTTILMFFKSGWHGHIFPDYPLAMMVSMLSRMPLWAIAGGLIGLACAMLRLALTSEQTHAAPEPEQ